MRHGEDKRSVGPSLSPPPAVHLTLISTFIPVPDLFYGVPGRVEVPSSVPQALGIVILEVKLGKMTREMRSAVCLQPPHSFCPSLLFCCSSVIICYVLIILVLFLYSDVLIYMISFC